MANRLINIPITKSMRAMSAKELRQTFEWFLKEINPRIRQLCEVVQCTSGFQRWRGSFSVASLVPLGAWFVTHVKDRKLSQQEMKAIHSGPIPASVFSDRDLNATSLSLCVDIGMYMGEVIRKRYPRYDWYQFRQAKTYVDFGWPVIFDLVEEPINPIRVAMTLAYDAVDGKPDPRRLARICRELSRESK